jgi:hypothetical protein
MQTIVSRRNHLLELPLSRSPCLAVLVFARAGCHATYFQVCSVHDVLWDASNEVEALEHNLVVKHAAQQQAKRQQEGS